MTINSEKSIKNTNQIQKKLFKFFFLKDFNKKSFTQALVAIVYTILLFLVSCIGFIPIVTSFIPEIDLSNESPVIHGFLLASFICSFVFLFDLIIRLTVMLEFYGLTKLRSAIRKQFLSVYCYIELITFITTISLIAVHGKFVSDGIMLVTNEISAIDTTVICFVFLANLINCFHRVMVFSHNEKEIKMFRHILKNKLKIWAIFIVVMVVVLLAFSFFIFISDQAQATIDNPSDFHSMADAMYFCIVTITTVGFGDIVAKSSVSRTYVVILMVVGVFLYSFLSSQIISVFGEYFAGKKQISQEVSLAKKKEEDLNSLAETVENKLLETLYKAKVITKANYNRLLKAKQANNEFKSNCFDESKFTFDSNNKTIYYKEKMLGQIVTDENEIHKAEETVWAVNKKALKDKKSAASTVLYKLPMKRISEIIDEKVHTQLIFSRLPIQDTIKRMVFYQKKPFLSARCEAEVKGVYINKKELVWEKFGIYSDLSKKKFFNIFKDNEEVTVILITNIIIYKYSKSIQEYGINDPSLLSNKVTPLM